MLRQDTLHKMLYLCYVVAIVLSLANGETVVKELKVSKSQDITLLRVEYFQSGSAILSAITYSLWKGKFGRFIRKFEDLIVLSIDLKISRNFVEQCMQKK